MTSPLNTEPTLAEDALSDAEDERQVHFRGSPGSGSSSSTSLASFLPALRNDSGEAVWRLTEKAMSYLDGLRCLPFRTVDEVLPSRGHSIGQCDKGGTSTP